MHTDFGWEEAEALKFFEILLGTTEPSVWHLSSLMIYTALPQTRSTVAKLLVQLLMKGAVRLLKLSMEHSHRLQPPDQQWTHLPRIRLPENVYGDFITHFQTSNSEMTAWKLELSYMLTLKPRPFWVNVGGLPQAQETVL